MKTRYNIILSFCAGFCAFHTILWCLNLVLMIGGCWEWFWSFPCSTNAVLALRIISAIIGGLALFLSLENERLEEEKRYERLKRWQEMP
jgi:hypothetical protein